MLIQFCVCNQFSIFVYSYRDIVYKYNPLERTHKNTVKKSCENPVPPFHTTVISL